MLCDCFIRNDVIDAQHSQLVGGEGSIGNPFGATRHYGSDKKWHGQEDSFAFDGLEHFLEQLPKRQNFTAAEFEGFAVGIVALECNDNGTRNILDKNRLKSRTPPADERKHGRESRHGCESVKEIIFGPEQYRGAHHYRIGEKAACEFLAACFRLRITCRRINGGSKRGHLHEARHAERRGLAREVPGCFGVDVIEAGAAAFLQDADEINDREGVVHEGCAAFGVTDIGGGDFDLPDSPHRLQKERAVGAAYADAHGVSQSGEMLDEVASEKPRPAEDDDRSVSSAGGGVGVLRDSVHCVQACFR